MKLPAVALVRTGAAASGHVLIESATHRVAARNGWQIFEDVHPKDLPDEIDHVIVADRRMLFREDVEWDYSRIYAECSFGRTTLLSARHGVLLGLNMPKDPIAAGIAQPFPPGFVQYHFDPNPVPGPVVDFSSVHPDEMAATFDTWISNKVSDHLLPPDFTPDGDQRILVLPFLGMKASKSEALRHAVRSIAKHWHGNYRLILAGDHYPANFLHDQQQTAFLHVTGFRDMLAKLARFPAPFTLLSTRCIPCGDLCLDVEFGFLERPQLVGDIAGKAEWMARQSGEITAAVGTAALQIRQKTGRTQIYQPITGFPLRLAPVRIAQVLADYPDVTELRFPTLYLNSGLGIGLHYNNRTLLRGDGHYTSVKPENNLLLSIDEQPDPVLRRYLLTELRPCRFEQPR